MVGWSDHVAQAAGVLAGGHLNCILHGTRSESFPGTEVAAIREQTRSPIIVVASSTANELLEEALTADIADVLVLPQLSTTSSSRSARPRTPSARRPSSRACRPAA